MKTRNEIPDEQGADEQGAGNQEGIGEGAAGKATVAAARAIQADAGTTSAVEYLKALDVEASVIEDILADEIGSSSN